MMIQCPECGNVIEDAIANCPSCGCLLAGDDEPTRIDKLPSFESGAKVADRYEIISEVGKGGFGRVFRAQDLEAKRSVALKVLNPAIMSEEGVHARFLGELKIAKRVAHPNVIRPFDVLELAGSCVIVMEFVEGQSLKQMIRNEGQFDIQKAKTIISQVCLGLDAAHQVGVVHRDIKPQNILITKNLGVKIVDFGLARHLGGRSISHTGMILGTPDYMSPEQVSGKTVDARSDIYSLGVVMYEMFTGKLPFTGETSVALIMAHLRKPPESPKRLRPELPPWISYMILKAMAKKPSKRFRKSTEILEYMERSIEQTEGVPDEESPTPVPVKTQRPPIIKAPEARRPIWADRKWRLLSAALFCFILLLAVVAFIAIRTHFESSGMVRHIISVAKQYEEQLDYYGAYQTYISGINEVPGSVSLYARAAIAYIQHFSRQHPSVLIFFLLGALIVLSALLFLIQRKLKR